LNPIDHQIIRFDTSRPEKGVPERQALGDFVICFLLDDSRLVDEFRVLARSADKAIQVDVAQKP